MLETVLKLYVMAMAGDVRSPTPHLFGPPGCGKSTIVEQAAKLLNVNLHVINVSRISPLELEGVQMPDKDHAQLNLLTATYWKQLKEGDIVLLDEFLRGFPEVYNGLLDIMTSRRVAGFVLPKVFFIAASNSTVAYDKALEDRLLHLTVPDPRHNKEEAVHIRGLIVESLGLLPAMMNSMEMERLLDNEIKPTYELLDVLKGKTAVSAASIKGTSVRNLIGQAKLRHVTSHYLAELLAMNNVRAIQEGKYQFVLLHQLNNIPPKYLAAAPDLVGNLKLTPIQALNLQLNLQLMSLENARKEPTTNDDDNIFVA